MKRSPRALKLKPRITPIKTSFLELLGELTLLTKNDALVVAAVKNIFASHKVRFARTLAPVKLTAGTVPLNLRKRRSAWAC